MRARLCILVLVVCCLIFGKIQVRGQNRQIGGVFAFNEMSATFNYANTKETSLEFSLNIDMNGVLTGKNIYPGGSVQFIYGFMFAEKTFQDGERIYGIAGPGVKAGYVKNHHGHYGAMAGLCGKIGLVYDFCVPVSLSVSLVPLFAFHINSTFDGAARMDLHKYGLGASVFPHISILYRF